MAPCRNVEDCCRLCAIEVKNGVVIYSSEGIHLCLEEKIIQCLRIEVSKNDLLPKKVCQSCHTRLEDYHRFAQQANRVQHTLELLVQMKNQNPNVTTLGTDMKEYGEIEEDIQIKNEIEELPLDIILESESDDHNESKGTDVDECDEIDVKLETDIEIKNELDELPLDVTLETENDNQIERNTAESNDEDENSTVMEPQPNAAQPDMCTQKHKMLQPMKTPFTQSAVSKCHKYPTHTTSHPHCSLDEEEYEEDSNKMNETQEELGVLVTIEPENELAIKIEPSEIEEDSGTEEVKEKGDEENEDKEAADISANEEWNTPDIKCNVCQQIFPFRSQFDKHYQHLHDKKPIYTCSYCNKTMEKYSVFRAHCCQRVTESGYRCEYCQKGFSLSSLLHVHILAKHTTVKPFICEECGKGFVTRSRLNGHLKKHKTEEKLEYPCTDCGKILQTRGGLTAHQNVHNLRRRFMCDVCGKTFSQKMNMEEHVKCHMNEHPFAFEECG